MEALNHCRQNMWIREWDLERLVRVLQGKNSNYDTDIFTGTISEVEKITGKKYDYRG